MQIQENIPLRQYNTFRINALARHFGVITSAEDLKVIPFNSLHIFHPSLLLGDRKNESRPAEAWMQKIFKAIAILLPAKYKPVYARDVAAAMIAAIKKNKTGIRVYEYKQMMRLIR